MKIETFMFLDLNYYFEDIQEVTALVFVHKCLVLFCLVRAKQRSKCHKYYFCSIVQGKSSYTRNFILVEVNL